MVRALVAYAVSILLALGTMFLILITGPGGVDGWGKIALSIAGFFVVLTIGQLVNVALFVRTGAKHTKGWLDL